MGGVRGLVNAGRARKQWPAGVVIGRLVLLLSAAAALVVGLAVSRQRPPTSGDAGAQYVCPMHPRVASGVPGDCPICNMALVRARDGQRPGAIVATHRAVAEVRLQPVAQVVRAPAWVGRDGAVITVLHRESMQGLRSGDQAVFFRNAEPARGTSVRLTSQPATPWDDATVQIRFAAAASAGPDGDTGWVQLEARKRELLVVPESAVLYSGAGAYVLAARAGEQTFERRAIQVGSILDSGYVADRAAERLGGIAVLAGLREGERVVTADTFVLDAERRLRAAQGQPEDVLE